jgi:hypothetical protein
MTCTDFEALLDEQFGPALLRNDPALVEHAAACGDCRARFDAHRLLADALVDWREQTPDVDLTAAVMAGLEPQSVQPASPHGSVAAGTLPAARSAMSTAERRPPARLRTLRKSTIAVLDRSRRSLVAAALALTALVAVVSLAPALRDFSRPADSVVIGPRANFGPAPQLSDRDVPRNQNPLIARTDNARIEAPAPYSGLVQLAAGAWDEVTLLVTPESKDTAPPDHSPPSNTKDGWIDGLQHQLKPIGKGLDNAFDFLWQAGQSGDG